MGRAPMLADRFGRPLSNLRVSVNEACNLRCSYCHLEGGAMTAGDVTVEEYARLFGIARGLGMRALKITGGEPTLHPELARIVAHAAALFDDVSMTTNGLLLERLAAPLAQAGLHRVNVSLDTLDRERYKGITGVDGVDRVVAGIRAARAAGLDPVKLNMVVLRGVNVDEVSDMEAFARDEGVMLQLIELHTDRLNVAGIDFEGGFVSLGDIEGDLAARAERVEPAPQHARKRYHLGHADQRERLGDVVVEVVRPYGNADFCAQCHRLRLTGDGKLKPCLMRFDNYVDVLGPLRARADDAQLEALFRKANDRRSPYWKPAGACPVAKPLRVVQ